MTPSVGGRVAWPAAIVLGVLSSLNFDPVGLPFAMVVAVAGLIWLAHALRDARKRTVMLTGALYGLSFMGPLIWWMSAVSDGAYVGLVLAETLFFIPIMLALRAVGPAAVVAALGRRPCGCSASGPVAGSRSPASRGAGWRTRRSTRRSRRTPG